MLRIFSVVSLLCVSVAMGAQVSKQQSAFYPPALTARAKANAAKYPWAARMHRGIVEGARPWMRLSDEELWSLMFGCTITRSHHVWSAGHCPACKRPVPMYDWQIDAIERPWKVRCPHCSQQFPKNDFHRFYRSGLDEHGVFDPKRADPSLLVNAEHPDPADPLHRFGVDDGEGYVEGDKRWRFAGTYLLYGQWWQLVLGGIENLAAAYTVTGEQQYAHRAAILLDRVADVFPTFDYGAQGLVYELPRYGGGRAGYVSYSIDSAYDVRKLALAYDQIFEGLRQDEALVRFLSGKSAKYGLGPKGSMEEIRRNIEERILRDALAHPEKMHTNYPGLEGALAVLKTVLGWPGNRTEILAAIDEMVAEGTVVDGVTGEKGLNGYATIAPNFLGHTVEMYARADPALLPGLLKRHPKFAQTYRFFVDMWAGRQYYPSAGDAGGFARRDTRYAGLVFNRGDGSGKMEMNPPVSMFSFLWRFYKATGDPTYLRILKLANDGKTEGLPFDLFAEDPAALVADVERAGPFPKTRSANKTEWRIGMLRSPHDEGAAVWLDYDSVPNAKIKSHYHRDAMNLGLYAKGLDLLPDFGYPAVQFGSWHTPQARWHARTAAHNTVVVDGLDQSGGDGRSTLWADGAAFRALRASSPDQIKGKQYERTAAMIDLGGSEFYVFDVFRVVGGRDHAKFTHGHFGTLVARGLELQPAPDYGHQTLMRNFRGDLKPQSGWSVDWKAEDGHGYLAPGAEVHLGYTDLTSGAEAYLCETWTVRSALGTEEFWIPTVVARRRGTDLASTFVGVLEPYEKRSAIAGIRRLKLTTPSGAAYGDANVAVEVKLADGRRDTIIAADSENPLALAPSLASDKMLVEGESGVRLAGEMAHVRWSAAGGVERVALCGGDYLRAGDLELRLKKKTGFVEIAVRQGQVSLESGNREDIGEIRLAGRRVSRFAR